MERITIDPITRLEGHGKIEIFLDEEWKKKALSQWKEYGFKD